MERSADCQQICTNTPGNFVCSCMPGYELNSDNTTCTDSESYILSTSSSYYIGVVQNAHSNDPTPINEHAHMQIYMQNNNVVDVIHFLL